MMGLIVLLISTVPEMDVSVGDISAISMDDIPRLTTLWLCNGIPGSCLCSKQDRTGESLTSIWQSKNSPDCQAHPGSHSEHDMDHPSQPQLAQWLDHMSPPDRQWNLFLRTGPQHELTSSLKRRTISNRTSNPFP